jgi:DNA-binding protein HU-beta
LAAEMVDLVTRHLKNGDRVRMSGLGTIEVKDRPARMGRNPATGQAIQIAASKKVAFRAAKELKEAMGTSRTGAGSVTTATRSARSV